MREVDILREWLFRKYKRALDLLKLHTPVILYIETLKELFHQFGSSSTDSKASLLLLFASNQAQRVSQEGIYLLGIVA